MYNIEYQHFSNITHTNSHHPITPSTYHPTSKSWKYMSQTFCCPVASSRITTSQISQSRQVRFFIAQSSLKHFSLYQPVAANSMHTQPTYTPHLQHLLIQRRIYKPVKHLAWSLFAKIVNVLTTLSRKHLIHYKNLFRQLA